ncbi:MAG: DUF934 domain-containing protein [Pseudomonadota bacterium]
MSVIVRDDGFHSDDWNAGYEPGGLAVDVTSEDDIGGLDLANTQLIRVAFPSFADGRGFTLGQRLRQLGYKGRLRAAGHVLADQYTMARRSGFDEVEIDADLAARQPADQWVFRANWQAHDYQARLRAKPAFH